MLAHRVDYGLRGTADGELRLIDFFTHVQFGSASEQRNSLLFFSTEEVLKLLAQLMALKGMETNPDKPGCEKLVISPVQRAWLKSDPLGITSTELGFDPAVLSPQQAFTVKGWNRSVSCLLCLLATYQSEDLRKAMPDEVKSSLSLVGRYEAQAACNLLLKVDLDVRNELERLEHLQRLCGGYLAALSRFSEHVPAKHLAEVQDEILKAFLLRHADADLMNMLTTSVPPADLGMIQVFKSQLAKWTQKAGCHSWVSLKTIGPSKLSAQLKQTTFQQTQLKMDSDESTLMAWADQFQMFASQQGGLDLRYLEDRYHKGKKRVQELMSAQHALQAYPSLVLAHADIVQKQASLGNSTFLAWSNYKY
ncbi:Uncharacterized protein SCF082_LOCUS19332 [Durusdinium trenchii]|uniref:Uncharacterized protein n=1 Tax=Durusdinium trenchii TaxID=1381693 RepID=A0ABP0KV90_9DINO